MDENLRVFNICLLNSPLALNLTSPNFLSNTLNTNRSEMEYYMLRLYHEGACTLTKVQRMTIVCIHGIHSF